MKTITEFSGILLQRAAEVQRAFRAANPPPAASVPEEAQPGQADAVAPTGDAETQGAAPTDEAAVAEGAGEGTAEAPSPSEESSAAEAPPAEPPVPVDLGTGPEAEAVGEAMQMQGDRLSRLMEALDVAGRRAGHVRLVRVLQGEPPPQGAQKRGEYYYAIDLAPRPQSQQREAADGRDDRQRGRGGRERGGRPGDRRPGGSHGAGGPPGKGGKFSNDRPSGRDGDLREGRGEVPRAGAGWMLTRAPDDWRGRADEPGVERRDRRPPRGPRPDGVRPPMGARGDRPPRGPRPDRGGRPGFAGGRPEGGGGRPPAPGRPEGRDASAGAGHGSRRPPGPRPSEGSGPRGDERPWAGRRRGGWDEPAVPEAVAPAVPVAPAADEAPASVESMPVPAGDGSANVAADSTATPSTTGNS